MVCDSALPRDYSQIRTARPLCLYTAEVSDAIIKVVKNMSTTINTIEYREDERGGRGLPTNAADTTILDDVDGLNIVLPNQVFHLCTVHCSSYSARKNSVRIYDGPLAAANLRRTYILPSTAHLEVVNIRGVRFNHSTTSGITVYADNATTSFMFVHIGGVIRNN